MLLKLMLLNLTEWPLSTIILVDKNCVFFFSRQFNEEEDEKNKQLIRFIELVHDDYKEKRQLKNINRK